MTGLPILKDTPLPFCKGCGHTHVAKNTEKALHRLGLDPLDVVLVTDIGCHGIVDKSFLTHTVHGLHGRAVALAGGISAGLENPAKKVVVFIGDGGATIGMQHLVGAAHRDIDITVVVHNNMLYGMTGGQPSDFTPCGFKTPTVPDGASRPGYDICKQIAAAGASRVERVIGVGDFSAEIAEAISTPGFSLVEVMEICPSHGVKSNPGMKLKKIVEESGQEVKVFVTGGAEPPAPSGLDEPHSLLQDSLELLPVYPNSLARRIGIMVAGSAGGGVRSAAERFAKAAIISGLDVTLRGAYPVTVGVGFSAAQINVSPDPILFTGSSSPDVLIVTSKDGANYARPFAAKMTRGLLVVDESLEEISTSAEIVRVPMSAKVGTRESAVFGLLWYLDRERIFPIEAMMDVLTTAGMTRRAKIEKLLQF